MAAMMAIQGESKVLIKPPAVKSICTLFQLVFISQSLVKLNFPIYTIKTKDNPLITPNVTTATVSVQWNIHFPSQHQQHCLSSLPHFPTKVFSEKE